MAENPYKILGVDENASMDEVKKAYRKKARENHPDLNPGDPNAAERMNRINEAYDRIMNPDKYAASDRRKQQSSSTSGRSGGYGYGSSGGYSQSGRSSQDGYGGYGRQSQEQGGYGGYRSDGPGGWTGDFDFDFYDFFGGAAYARRAEAVHPGIMAGDSPEIIAAINAINSNNSASALKILATIKSSDRNARWHYISAIANKYEDREVRALEHIRRALQMDPNNPDYEKAHDWIRQSAHQYQAAGNARGFSMDMTNMAAICCGIWVCGPTMCRFCMPYGYGMC